MFFMRVQMITLKLLGDICLKVVASSIGGTTHMEFHFSGSQPTWMARVGKVESFSLKPSICFSLRYLTKQKSLHSVDQN